MLTAWVYNSFGCLVGTFERGEFEKACGLVKDDDKVCIEKELFQDGCLCGVEGERMTGAEFVRLYGGQNV